MGILNSTTTRIQSFFRKFGKIFYPASKNLSGSQRPYSSFYKNDDNLWGRNFDREIKEIVIRDPEIGVSLVQMFECCPEVSSPIYQIVNAMRSSVDGDDQGFAIASTLNDKETKIDPQIKYYLDRLVEEKIGSAKLEWAMQRFLAYGDAFASFQIDISKQRIASILPIPTWQVFRVESDSGDLWRFEQRHNLIESSGNNSYGTAFLPAQVVHWRFRRYALYGRSLFHQSIDDWEGLKSGLNTLENALLEVGINPNIHIMPCDVPEGYAEAYKEALQTQRLVNKKPVADYFMLEGGDVKKVSTRDPDLKAILQVLNFHKQRFVMASNTPPWMLAWEMQGGGREISQSPALAYARFINGCRQAFAEGLRHFCNIELALNGIPQERWKYRIIWPKIYINPYEQQLNPQADESNHPSVDNLD